MYRTSETQSTATASDHYSFERLRSQLRRHMLNQSAHCFMRVCSDHTLTYSPNPPLRPHRLVTSIFGWRSLLKELYKHHCKATSFIHTTESHILLISTFSQPYAGSVHPGLCLRFPVNG